MPSCVVVEGLFGVRLSGFLLVGIFAIVSLAAGLSAWWVWLRFGLFSIACGFGC